MSIGTVTFAPPSVAVFLAVCILAGIAGGVSIVLLLLYRRAQVDRRWLRGELRRAHERWVAQRRVISEARIAGFVPLTDPEAEPPAVPIVVVDGLSWWERIGKAVRW